MYKSEKIGILLLFISHAAQAHICRTLEVKQDAVAQEERLQFHFLRNGFGRNPGLTLNLTPPPQLPFQIQIHAKMEEMCTDAKKSCKFCTKFCTKRKAQVFLNEHQLRWAQQNRFSVAGKTLCSCFWFKPQNSSDRRSERGNSYAADKFPLDLPCRHTVLRCSACH